MPAAAVEEAPALEVVAEKPAPASQGVKAPPPESPGPAVDAPAAAAVETVEAVAEAVAPPADRAGDEHAARG